MLADVTSTKTFSTGPYFVKSITWNLRAPEKSHFPIFSPYKSMRDQIRLVSTAAEQICLSVTWSQRQVFSRQGPYVVRLFLLDSKGQLSKNILRKRAIIFLSISLNMCFGCSKEPFH